MIFSLRKKEYMHDEVYCQCIYEKAYDDIDEALEKFRCKIYKNASFQKKERTLIKAKEFHK